MALLSVYICCCAIFVFLAVGDFFSPFTERRNEAVKLQRDIKKNARWMPQHHVKVVANESPLDPSCMWHYRHELMLSSCHRGSKLRTCNMNNRTTANFILFYWIILQTRLIKSPTRQRICSISCIWDHILSPFKVCHLFKCYSFHSRDLHTIPQL